MARAGPAAAHHGMKQFHKSHASFCRSLISTLLSFLTIFRSRNFFEFSPMSSVGEKMFLFRSTPCVCVHKTQGIPFGKLPAIGSYIEAMARLIGLIVSKQPKRSTSTSKKLFQLRVAGLGGGGCRTLTAIWWRQLIRLLLLLPSQFFSPKSQSVTSSKSISP